MTSELKNRFAIVDTWPHFQAAEHEAMERIRNAAISVGKECIFVDRFLNKLEAVEPGRLAPDEVDFVINLHFESGKVYDAFSFYALWNPLQFYYDWGYQTYSKHVDSHDDFLTCGSSWADDHLARRIYGDSTRLPPKFAFYHSLAKPVIPPRTEARKTLFYCGINWEKLGKPVGRYHGVLTLLDPTGDLRIYGPDKFHGVAPWEGYKSYSGPIPFDGVSVVERIADCGVALVLSSDAHKESELMSARMYESLAAGAVIIADENPFVRRELEGDALYIDGTKSDADVFGQIQEHLSWIRENPDEALLMAQRAQQKFLSKYAMDRCIDDIYAGLAARKKQLRSMSHAKTVERKVHVLFPLYNFDEKRIRAATADLIAQSYSNITGALIIDSEVYNANRWIVDRIAGSALAVVTCDRFAEPTENNAIWRRTRLGLPVTEYCITRCSPRDLVMVVDPSERIYQDHVTRLVRKFEDYPEATCAASDMVIRHFGGNGVEYREIRSGIIDIHRPLRGGETIGWGRFLFDANRVNQLATMVRYLDYTVVTPMLFDGALGSGIQYSRHATVMHDVQTVAPRVEKWLDQEREIVLDGFRLELPRLIPHIMTGIDHPGGSATLMNSVTNLSPNPTFFNKSFDALDPSSKAQMLASLMISVRQPWFVRLFLKLFYGLRFPPR